MNANTETLAVELQDVGKVYGEEVKTEAVRGVNLAIPQGEMTALIGPSGSGKSTLLNLIGLLDRPTRGSLSLAGVPTRSMGDAQLTELRGRTIGFVFQFHHLLLGFSAEENVFMPLAIAAGVIRPSMRTVARELLTEVGLADKIQTRARLLSGGQQQRVAIARALASSPSILLADEPTGNLDSDSADEIFNLLRRFNRERKMTCIIVTHDTRIADRCDRIVRVVDGRIRE